MLAIVSAFPCNNAPLTSSQRSLNRLASERRHSPQGLCPAAKAVASSRKKSSVYVDEAITWRCRSLNWRRQVIHAFRSQRRVLSLRCSLWMRPRLPMKDPRSGTATISAKGVTRFCSGMMLSETLSRTRARQAVR